MSTEFYKVLTYWREKRGLSQAQLARISGVPEPQLSRLAHEGIALGDESVIALQKALKIPRKLRAHFRLTARNSTVSEINKLLDPDQRIDGRKLKRFT